MGWLIARERRYSPRIEALPGLTSSSNPMPYRSFNVGGDKMSSTRHGYARAYASLLGPRVQSIETVVELGVFQGSSLAVWCDLFPHATVVGLDVQLSRFAEYRPVLDGRGAFTTNAPKLVVFDAFSPNPADVMNALGGRRIDLFVDDGPHNLQAIVQTAQAMLPLMNANSLYIVEDNVGALRVLQTEFPHVSFNIVESLVVAHLNSNIYHQ